MRVKWLTNHYYQNQWNRSFHYVCIVIKIEKYIENCHLILIICNDIYTFIVCHRSHSTNFTPRFNIQHSTFNIKYSKIITVIRQIFKDINGSYSTSALIHYILMAQDTGQRSNFSIALNKCQTSYDGNIITYISRPHNPSLNVFS